MIAVADSTLNNYGRYVSQAPRFPERRDVWNTLPHTGGCGSTAPATATMGYAANRKEVSCEKKSGIGVSPRVRVL